MRVTPAQCGEDPTAVAARAHAWPLRGAARHSKVSRDGARSAESRAEGRTPETPGPFEAEGMGSDLHRLQDFGGMPPCSSRHLWRKVRPGRHLELALTTTASHNTPVNT